MSIYPKLLWWVEVLLGVDRNYAWKRVWNIKNAQMAIMSFSSNQSTNRSHFYQSLFILSNNFLLSDYYKKYSVFCFYYNLFLLTLLNTKPTCKLQSHPKMQTAISPQLQSRVTSGKFSVIEKVDYRDEGRKVKEGIQTRIMDKRRAGVRRRCWNLADCSLRNSIT